MSERRLLRAERLLLMTGGLLVAVYALARVDSCLSSRAALRELDRHQPQPQRHAAAVPAQLQVADDVDFSLWSEERVAAFKESLALEHRRALAVLELARLRIRVPVFEGTDDLALNRGAGWIPGTARPGEPGNTGIAAHRDGFFRGLKDVALGDRLELRTGSDTMVYRVDQTEIVNPEDVYVLRPRGAPALTLITCYPFYHIGSAPHRFIVHATLQPGETSR
jgi:sortase A